MNRVSFGESACERTRKYLDSYISNELLIETNHEVLRHLEHCPTCSTEAATRQQLRARLKSAVRTQPVPAELSALVRERIRAEEFRKSSSWAWMRWPMAAAASVALCTLLYVEYRPEHLPAIGDRPGQTAYIQKISATIATVLKVGLGDHLHCSVFRKKSASVPTVAEMEKELGPEYKGLLPAMRAAAPEGYTVILAHHCSYLKRNFVHLTLEKDGRLMSLVIARKQEGESFTNLTPANEHGTPIFQSAAGHYQVAAFEAGNFLAYVISDMKSKPNLQVAVIAAPAIREVLTKIPA
ncbi:MAG TPA: zf-HC2 domain-containing protein [Chthoniobacterales bacterium]|nr:zf-HC2 domain-containing protein [Chthoniobacterales bacterium]